MSLFYLWHWNEVSLETIGLGVWNCRITAVVNNQVNACPARQFPVDRDPIFGQRWLLDHHSDNPVLAATVAFNFLMGAGTCIAGWLLAKSALIAEEKRDQDPVFYGAK